MSVENDDDDFLENERLVAFLYLLVKAGVPMVTMDALLRRALTESVELRGGALLEWSVDAADRLVSIPGEDELEDADQFEFGGFVA